MPKKPATKRGRPPAPKPTGEQLRPSVVDFCRQELIARRLQSLGGAWSERDAFEARKDVDDFIEGVAQRPLLRAWQEQDRLMGFYRHLLSATEAYAEIQGLIDSDAFEKATEFLQRIVPGHQGLESLYRFHLQMMRPHLDALLAQREQMHKVLAAEILEKYTPDSHRRRLLEMSYDAKQGRHMDILGLGRPLDVRELAMASLLTGPWPSVKAGDVSVDAVIHAEVVRMRLAAKERKIPLIEPPAKGAELSDRVDFRSCHFFRRRARATPVLMRINTAPLSAEEKEVLRRLVAPRGARRAAVDLGVSREVVVSALGGLNLRRGSLALLHAALAPHLAAASAQPSAAA